MSNRVWFRVHVGVWSLSEGIWDFTSIVVLDITAGGFHRGVTAGAPPAQLAHTVPAVVTQSAPAISVAQTRTTLCEKIDEDKDQGFTTEYQIKKKTYE